MKRLQNYLVISLLMSTFLLFAGVNAYAGCIANTVGDTTFITCDDGTSGTSNRIGDTTFYNFNDGTSGTSKRIGDTTL